ncbi:RecT-like ssDNA binding protein [Arthrobacter phage EvePickles]|nr:RecT-like ssDNA binding protein [Arthrobacter phage EvePickles]
MTDVQKYQPQESALSEQMRYAQAVAEGDLLPAAYRGKPANVLIAVGLGAPMGLTPSEALYRIDVIQGKPTASAELIASNVRKAGHKLRVRVDEQAQSVTATILRADDPDYEHTVVRDMPWAKKMGLDGKDNYKKQPVTMLQWRAITAVARLACPEALYGVSYTADELEDLGERRQLAAPAASAVAALVNAAATSEPITKPAPASAESRPVIPDEVVANTERALAEGTIDQYIAWLAENNAPENIIDYVSERKPG